MTARKKPAEKPKPKAPAKRKPRTPAAKAKPKARAKPAAKPKATTTTRKPTTKAPVTHKSLFLPGNKFWERRSSHGIKPKFADADELMDACCQYFADVQSTPMIREEAKVVDSTLTFVHQPLARPFTIGGMCIFIDVAHRSWMDWKHEGGDHYRADLSHVIAWAEEVCRNQAFELAAAGLVNANIISRYLGLADKQDHQSTDASMSPPTVVTLRGVRPEPQPEEED